LDLEKSTLILQLQQARAEVEELRSLMRAGELPSASPALPEAGVLLNQLRTKLKGKTKTNLRDMEVILEMLS
jgi:hypothetical protein